MVREERHLRQTLQQLTGAKGEPAPEPEPKTIALYRRLLAELPTAEPAAAG